MAAQISSNYTITHSLPTPEDYVRLRTVSGLTPPPKHTNVAAALKVSLHCIVARHTPPGVDAAEGKAIGMVRALGDGHVFVNIYDMCVDPEHQRQGLGKAMLKDMLAWIDANASTAYVSLEADPPGVRLYESVGFRMAGGKAMCRGNW